MCLRIADVARSNEVHFFLLTQKKSYIPIAAVFPVNLRIVHQPVKNEDRQTENKILQGREDSGQKRGLSSRDDDI